MSLDRLTAPTPTAPADITDYQHTNDLLYAFGLWGMGASPIDLTNNKVVKGALFNVGGVVYFGTSDTTITGTPSSYVKITPSGATASASYVANLTGVSWSDTYNGYVDGSGNLYIFDEAKAIYSGTISTPKTMIGKIQYIFSSLFIKSDLTILGDISAKNCDLTGPLTSPSATLTDLTLNGRLKILANTGVLPIRQCFYDVAATSASYVEYKIAGSRVYLSSPLRGGLGNGMRVQIYGTVPSSTWEAQLIKKDSSDVETVIGSGSRTGTGIIAIVITNASDISEDNRYFIQAHNVFATSLTINGFEICAEHGY